MRFKELLEAKQVGILYHFTSVAAGLNIIKDNKLIGSRPPKSNGIYVSFTRNKNFIKQPRYGLGGTAIAFVVDGNKLSNKYKFEQFNYYNDPEQERDWGTGAGSRKEQEERILTTKIPNFLNYVKEVWLFKSKVEDLFYAANRELNIVSTRFFNSGDLNINDIIKKFKDKKLKVVIK